MLPWRSACPCACVLWSARHHHRAYLQAELAAAASWVALPWCSSCSRCASQAAGWLMLLAAGQQVLQPVL